MKAVIEFGVRGGRSSGELLVSSAKIAAAIANDLAYVFGRDAKRNDEFTVSKRKPRISWQSATHYVAVSILDGVVRGSAAGTLWKKD